MVERQVHAGWERHYDEVGASYFYNPTTGESQWDAPDGASAGAAAEQASDGEGGEEEAPIIMGRFSVPGGSLQKGAPGTITREEAHARWGAPAREPFADDGGDDTAAAAMGALGSFGAAAGLTQQQQFAQPLQPLQHGSVGTGGGHGGGGGGHGYGYGGGGGGGSGGGGGGSGGGGAYGGAEMASMELFAAHMSKLNKDYMALSKEAAAQSKFRHYQAELDAGRRIRCVLCGRGVVGDVLFPCQHMCACQACLHEHAIAPGEGCPLCMTVIRRVLPHTGEEEQAYWDWCHEVKPPLPRDFGKNFVSGPRLEKRLRGEAAQGRAKKELQRGQKARRQQQQQQQQQRADVSGSSEEEDDGEWAAAAKAARAGGTAAGGTALEDDAAPAGVVVKRSGKRACVIL